ncbi:hypothetical protein L0F63_004335, partial [Massospora cicadina]
EIIAQNKRDARKQAKKLPQSKSEKFKPKPLNTGNRSKPRSESAPKGQWRHDRFEAFTKPYKRAIKDNRSSDPISEGKPYGPISSRLSQREGPLLSRAAREAKAKAAPITTAQLRANSKAYSPPEPRARARVVERTPAPAPKPAAPRPTPSIAIKGSSGPATVLVSNLDPEANTADLREYFGQFGEVMEVSLLYDEHSRCSGNAEIKYGRKSDAQLAVDKMHNVVADDRVISVQLKPDPTPSARALTASRQESRALPASSRGASGPVRSAPRVSVVTSPYARLDKRATYRR